VDRKFNKVIWLLCTACLSVFPSPAQTPSTGSASASPSVKLTDGLSWLPPDTESLIVSNGPLTLPAQEPRKKKDEDEERSRPLTFQDLRFNFADLSMGLLGFKGGLLMNKLKGITIALAIEGSRNFRSPASLGEMPFEGCQVIVFAENVTSQADAFWKESASTALETETIEGLQVAVFQEKMEEDLWKFYAAFPRPNVVAIATNRDYLQEVLARIRGAKGPRALPEILPEWKYVDTKAFTWGLRHYDKSQAKLDPSSPFGGEKPANFPDDKAIGVSFQFGPGQVREATVTYLSGGKQAVSEVQEGLFPMEGEPEAAGLHVHCRELVPGAVQCSFQLTRSDSAGLFFFVVPGLLGHAIYL
jgi:hypothetical protein